MIGCDAASSDPWRGSSIAILTVPLVAPPLAAALGLAPLLAAALGLAAPLGAGVAPLWHAANTSAVEPTRTPNLWSFMHFPPESWSDPSAPPGPAPTVLRRPPIDGDTLPVLGSRRRDLIAVR